MRSSAASKRYLQAPSCAYFAKQMPRWPKEEVLAALELQRAAGAITPQNYAKYRADIAAERQAMAAALIETEGHATQAAANLRTAQEQGQTGLEWHINATSELAREASSARSSISLL